MQQIQLSKESTIYINDSIDHNDDDPTTYNVNGEWV
jgi:hypothetical protein